MSVAVWGTDFLANVAGLSQANAALAFGAFPAAMLTGRFAGSRLTLSIAVGLAADQTNQASARASLAVGIALLTAPLLLGWLADRIGIQNAYGMVIVLVIVAAAVVINNRLLLKRKVASHL